MSLAAHRMIFSTPASYQLIDPHRIARTWTRFGHNQRFLSSKYAMPFGLTMPHTARCRRARLRVKEAPSHRCRKLLLTCMLHF